MCIDHGSGHLGGGGEASPVSPDTHPLPLDQEGDTLRKELRKETPNCGHNDRRQWKHDYCGTPT